MTFSIPWLILNILVPQGISLHHPLGTLDGPIVYLYPLSLASGT